MPKKWHVTDECIQDLKEEGLIRPSISSWASAPVLVAKKSGGFRLAVDYRPLNSLTKVPVYPMAHTDWLLAQLGQAQWFSRFDMSQGFFQIPVAWEDVPKIAFICQQGTFEFTRMPFGVAGGTATFQTLMDRVQEGIKHSFAITFLDDMLVYSSILDEHMVHAQKVLNCIKAVGLTLNPNKVLVCCETLKFLGHTISSG